jgi:hypothetical protein
VRDIRSRSGAGLVREDFAPLVRSQAERVDRGDRAEFVEDGLGFRVEGHVWGILQAEVASALLRM